MPREDYIHSLALASVPAARKRRDETESERRARKSLAGSLEEKAWDIVESELNDPVQHDEFQVTERIKARLSKYAVDGGVGSSIRFSNLVSRLKSHPNRPRNISAILALLEQLSFSSRGDGQARGRSGDRDRATITMPSLNVPVPSSSNARGTGSRPHTGASSNHRYVSSAERSPSIAGEDHFGSSHTNHASSSTPNLSSLPPSERVKHFKKRVAMEEVPEEELLRDVIYLLQGINGRWISFEESFVMPNGAAEEGAEGGADRPQKVLRVVFKEDDQLTIPRTKRQLIHRITELGRLYKRINEFVEQKNQQPDAGLAMQSFCHFVSKEMTEYYRLIAILESQLNLGETAADVAGGKEANAVGTTKLVDEGEASGVHNAPSLTLKRVSIMTHDQLLRLRLISAIIERCQDAKGGALASLIHTYSFNGHPLIQKLTADLLEEVSRPFFDMLSKWIFEGELHDPFQEFFVQSNHDRDLTASQSLWTPYKPISIAEQLQDADAAAFWLHRFSLRPEMLPSFMTEEFGKKVFSTGKSLNFIRYACGASDWLPAQHLAGGQTTELKYSDIEGLQRTVNTAHKIVSKHLVDIFLNKLKLLDHLRALQDYLMLGKGDFVDLLKTQLEDYLNRPSNSLHRHNLTIALETAIRGSNAQFDDPEVIKRLDARLLEDSAGDTGWDVFTLDYKVDAPVNTILDGPAMQAYQLIFGHLWRVKRAEVALSTAWTRVTASRFELQKMRGKRKSKENPEGAAAAESLLKTLNRALLMLSEMNHMIRQLQGFFQLECAAYSWQDLLGSLKAEVDLDELIERHQKYVNALVSKILLRQSTRRNDPDFLANEVRATLTVILAYCAVSTELSHHVVSFVQEGGQDDNDVQGSILARLSEQSDKFQERLQTIIDKLERHSNLIVRELSTRLNFNMYYEASRKDRKREASHTTVS